MRIAVALAFFSFVASTLNAQDVKTFDVPNGTNTTPMAISSSGDIVGYYGDLKTSTERGFLRDHNGKISTFDCPAKISLTCVPTGIDPSGEIAGYAWVESDLLDFGFRGFLRNPNGMSITFDGPAAPIEGAGLFVTAINASGEIVGTDQDESETNHGFIREANGTIISFDMDPHGFFPGTSVTAVNSAGVIIGDGNAFDIFDTRIHGFVRQVDGSITTFDVLNADSTFPKAINAIGQLAGFWAGSDGIPHGFIRDADRNITVVDYPGATLTDLVAIDSRGRVAGDYSYAKFFVDDSHAFVRDPDGTFTTIMVPGSTYTTVSAMNPKGEITGVFSDANGQHGWVRKP